MATSSIKLTVVKAKPQKKIPETDAIFEQVNQINQQADEDELAAQAQELNMGYE